MKNFIAISFLFLASIALLSSCVGGGNSGSETTNGLSGIVHDTKGMPVKGARVTLYPEDYNPYMKDNLTKDKSSALPETKTNAQGQYLWNDLPPGQYHLEFSDSIHGTKSLLQGVVIGSDGHSLTLNGVLTAPGSLNIRLADYLAQGEKGYVYLPGSSFFQNVDSTTLVLNDLHLQGLAAGQFDQMILVIESPAASKTISIAENFKIQSDSTTLAEYFSTWKASKFISLNPASMGLQNTIVNYPFLVRLDSSNFNFNQAQANGNDLRFIRVNGKPLEYQIEKWDSLARKAEIWVRIDTIYAKNANQNLQMFWGQANALAMVNRNPIFDTANGFSGVWHFSETANEKINGYLDITPNHGGLTSLGINANSQGLGIIGYSKFFNGNYNDSLGSLFGPVPKGIGGNGAFTVTFWMKFKLMAQRQTLMDFGTEKSLQDFHFLIRSDTATQFGGIDVDKSSGTDPATWQNVFNIGDYIEKWTFVATVYDPNKKSISTYFNGIKMKESITPALNIDKLGGLRLSRQLKIQPGDGPFNGDIDELRFYHTSLSPDQILLDFETQKQ